MRKKIQRRILSLALPVVASSLLERAVTTADIFLVGGLGPEPIAAVGLSQLMIFLFMSLIAGLSAGTTVVIAQLVGGRRESDAAEGALSALWVGLAIGALMGAAGFWFRREAAALLGAEGNLVELVDQYLFFIFLFFPVSVAVDLLSAIMHGRGDTRTPMVGIIGINLLHFGIAYLLIYGKFGFPSMGVRGAAVAVGVSEIFGAAFLFIRAFQKQFLKTAPVRTALIRRVIHVGLPFCFDRMTQQLAQIAYARTVLFYGTVAYAAHQVGLAIEAFSFMAGSGFAVAAVTSVGRSVGASEYERARIENWEANRLAVLVMSAMGILFFFFPFLLMKAFTKDLQVIALGTLFLKVAALIQIPLAVTMVLSGSLKGAGDTRSLLAITFVGAWLVRVPLAYYFSFVAPLGVVYVWGVMVLDWYVRMAFTLARYRSEKWRNIEVIGEGNR
ncbi:MAG TPA: MATE family efflux transporter [Candidatus Manganitrophaceae bacterium]|nr:MATE family efflux transporter [Candidatus Manganitrophaceae bacterium]